jgi:cell wall-associated NlpC family hydrolase
VDDIESEMRKKIVSETMTWVGTPYVSNAMVKGKSGGGTDCAMLLIAVYDKLGLMPGYVDPRPYSPQWHLHRNEEKYMTQVMRYAKEIEGPPKRWPKPGDLIMFKIGKLFAHGGIIIEWPIIVHAIGNATVMLEDISKSVVGKRALGLVPQRFFSLWPGEEASL